MSAFPTSSPWLDYFDEQKRFLKALPIELRKQVVVRLKGDYGWDQLDRWRDQFPEVVIDKGHKRITEQIRKNRLYIATYNATVYLDLFVWNIPTLIFWKPEHWEINDNSMPYFDILKSAGILHDTPESAARKMALVWDNIDTWWYSNKVQSARRQFCQKFSKVSDDSLNELRNIIQKVSKDKKYNKS
jgi:putative transferase (TIGR04331 family)